MLRLENASMSPIAGGVFVLGFLGVVLALALGNFRVSNKINSEPRFTDVRISHPQISTKPLQGVKIHYVLGNETGTFVY